MKYVMNAEIETIPETSYFEGGQVMSISFILRMISSAVSGNSSSAKPEKSINGEVERARRRATKESTELRCALRMNSGNSTASGSH